MTAVADIGVGKKHTFGGRARRNVCAAFVKSPHGIVSSLRHHSGSEFERVHGWHVNLMPHMVLDQLPKGWRDRASSATYGHLTVMVPATQDLLAPKLRRNEPRDQQHAALAREVGLL